MSQNDPFSFTAMYNNVLFSISNFIIFGLLSSLQVSLAKGLSNLFFQRTVFSLIGPLNYFFSLHLIDFCLVFSIACLLYWAYYILIFLDPWSVSLSYLI